MEEAASEQKLKEIVQMESILAKPRQYWIFKSCYYGLVFICIWALLFKFGMKLSWRLAITSGLPETIFLMIFLPVNEIYFLNFFIDLKRGKLELTNPGLRVLLVGVAAAIVTGGMTLALLRRFVW